MSLIKMNPTGVTSTIETSIRPAFNSLCEKLQEFSTQNSKVAEFWETKEAGTFLSRMAEVESSINTFIEKYNAYISFLNSAAQAYSEDKSNLANAIRSIGSEKK